MQLRRDGDRHQPVGDRGDERRRGDRQDPGPDDPAGDAPAHGRQTPDRSDADDGAGDRVRRADRHAEVRRGEERDRAGGLGGEPADRLSLVIFEPIVWMIRQPPDSVPSAIAACAASTTQNGIGRCPLSS